MFEFNLDTEDKHIIKEKFKVDVSVVTLESTQQWNGLILHKTLKQP